MGKKKEQWIIKKKKTVKDMSFYSTFMLISLLATVSWMLAENMSLGQRQRNLLLTASNMSFTLRVRVLVFPWGVQSSPAECCLRNPNIL